MADNAASVRAAAIATMSHFPREVLGAIKAGVGDRAVEVQLAAMRLARETVRAERTDMEGPRETPPDGAFVPAAAEIITPLAGSPEPVVQAERAGHADGPASFAGEKALAAAWVCPRRRCGCAAQNTALAGTPSAELTAALGNAGRNDDATIRCEALCSMAKLDFAAATGLLEAAAKDSNPLVRLGAVRGYAAAGKTDKALPFLDDPSEMVRLAAIRAAANEASAGAARRVMDLMIAAPQGEMRSVDSHLAAREALIAMHSRQVEELAAERLAEAMAGYRNTPREFQDLIGQYSKPPPAGQTREDFSVAAAALREHQSVHVRNVRSCCRILGAYRSRLALARLLNLVKTEPTESILLGDAAWALGEIGEASAAPPLERCWPST